MAKKPVQLHWLFRRVPYSTKGKASPIMIFSPIYSTEFEAKIQVQIARKLLFAQKKSKDWQIGYIILHFVCYLPSKVWSLERM